MGVQQQPTVVNKPKTTKPMSEARKIRKPLMERKRRERINTCLNDLASLLIDAKMVKAEPGKPTKLEKADILELTVKHIRSFKNQEKSTTTPTSEADEKENPTSSSYKEGFSKCMGMVDQTLGKAGKEALRQRLLTHLKSCLQSLEPPADKGTTDAESLSKDAAETTEEAESRLTAPEATTVISNDTDDEKDEDPKVDPRTSESSTKEPPTPPRLTLVPTRLPSGGVAFVIQGGIDPTMLLPQGDASDVKALPSETVSPPPSPVTCDSSTSSSPPASPPSLPDCSSAVSPPPPSSSSTSPCASVTVTTNQCPSTPSPPPSNNQDSTSDSADNQWSVRSSADHYPIPETYHQVTSCMPSPVFHEGQCPSVLPYATTTLYSTPTTPVTAYCVPATTSQEQHSSTHHHHHPHEVPTTSYHIQSIPSFPQPIHPPHSEGFYHHSHNPPTPPPSISPQHVYHPHQYQHYQPVSSEEDMDTDGVSEEEVDIDVENDVPYDLSMRRIWRYW